MEKPPQKFVITVIGPTCVGKTALSIEIAEALDTEIINLKLSE